MAGKGVSGTGVRGEEGGSAAEFGLGVMGSPVASPADVEGSSTSIRPHTSSCICSVSPIGGMFSISRSRIEANLFGVV